MRERKIIHIDLNNCFASITILHHPKLRGKPVAIGGDVEQRHGIILAKSYEAKAFGIKTGMAIWEAKQRCPSLIVAPPEYDKYLRFSQMMREIVGEYSNQCESFGIDELWCDVTDSLSLFSSSAEKLAHKIRKRIKFELGITASLGASWNKIFAKLGSDYKKPDAVTCIWKDNFKEIVWKLPAEEILGVGRATKIKLYKRNVTTIGAIANTDPKYLQSWFGKWGLILHAFANGHDTSPVEKMGNEAVVKSIGNSTTAPRDLVNERDCKIVFYNLAESVARRLRDLGLKGETIQISLRDNSLVSFERQMKLERPTNLAYEICNAAMKLLKDNYSFQKPLRSIGVRAQGLVPENQWYQLSLFSQDEAQREKREALERTIDKIRDRFGYYSIDTALMREDKLLGRLNCRESQTIHPIGYF